MKYLPLTILLSTLALSVPTGLRVLNVNVTPGEFQVGASIYLPVISGTNNPLGYAHQGFAAWWLRPDTNVWIPEWSTNGTDWMQGGQWSELPYRATRNGQPYLGWNFTERNRDTNQWSARIRRIK